jgi:hypothetical protein
MASSRHALCSMRMSYPSSFAFRPAPSTDPGSFPNDKGPEHRHQLLLAITLLSAGPACRNDSGRPLRSRVANLFFRKESRPDVWVVNILSSASHLVEDVGILVVVRYLRKPHPKFAGQHSKAQLGRQTEGRAVYPNPRVWYLCIVSALG